MEVQMYLTITVNGNTPLPGLDIRVLRGVNALKGFVESTAKGDDVQVRIRQDDEDVLVVDAQNPDPKALALLVAGYYPKRGSK
jgi:hypothetical protein